MILSHSGSQEVLFEVSYMENEEYPEKCFGLRNTKTGYEIWYIESKDIPFRMANP